MTRRGWTDWEYGMVMENDHMTARELGDELGRTEQAVRNVRCKLRKGWTPAMEATEEWTNAEDAMLRAYPYLSAPKLSAMMPGRTSEAIIHRRVTLRSMGVDLPRPGNSSPLSPGARPMLAKTCPDCGLLLQAKWFAVVSGAWRRRCTRCHEAHHATYRPKRNVADQRRRSKEHFARYQAMTVGQASNHRKAWTEDDFVVLADPDLTLLEKAFKLRRTYAAVSQLAQKSGYVSKIGLGDPERDQWIIDNPNAKEFAA